MALGLDQHSPSLVPIASNYLCCYFNERRALKNPSTKRDCSSIQEARHLSSYNLGTHLLFAEGRGEVSEEASIAAEFFRIPLVKIEAHEENHKEHEQNDMLTKLQRGKIGKL